MTDSKDQMKNQALITRLSNFSHFCYKTSTKLVVWFWFLVGLFVFLIVRDCKKIDSKYLNRATYDKKHIQREEWARSN